MIDPRQRQAPTPTGQARARLLKLAPLPLAIVAEAAWLTVVGGLMQEFALRSPEIGLPSIAMLVGAGVVLASTVGTRWEARWPVLALVLVAVAGTGGVLSSDAARTALANGPGAAIAAHPGGLIAAVALFRGYAYGRLPVGDGTLGNLLVLGTPGLAIAAILGGAVSEPFRTQFLDATAATAIVFLFSTVLALTLARLARAGGDHVLDWRHNPSWLVLAVALLGLAVAVALPLASIAGVLIALLVSISPGPLLIIGMAAGLDRASLRLVLLTVAGMLIVSLILAVFGARNLLQPGSGPPRQPIPDANSADPLLSLSVTGLALAAMVIGAFILIGLWMRRPRALVDDGVVEVRVVDRGQPGFRRSARRRWRRPLSTPAGSVEAYVSLLGELERYAETRRAPGETPAEHAARLRGILSPSLSLDLLAADYALVRDAGRTLTAAEERRGVERWRILRTTLPAWSKAQARAASASVDREDGGPRS